MTRVALVTGGTRGIGHAISIALKNKGYRVAANYAGNDAAAQQFQAETGIPVYKWNVGDYDACAKGVADVVKALGPIDVLVNNAGISTPAPIDSEGYEAVWARGVDVLLTAHTRTVRAALPWLRKSTSPRIVNIASTEGLGATKGISPYTAAKHGVIGLTRSLAVELGAEGITVNCICPGPIDTAMTARIPAEQRAKYVHRRVPLNRYADPEEVAQMTLSISLPAASFLTGATIPVDGGLTIRNA